MAAKNPDSLDHQDQFHARVVPAQPIGQKWHKPGNEQGNDAVPEYHAQTFPPGTAPKENTFYPNPMGRTQDIGEGVDTNNPEGTSGDALNIPGSTSKDVHNAIDFEHGKPMQGQTNSELRSGTHIRSGLENVGADRQENVFKQVRDQTADKDNVTPGQRGDTGRVEGGMAAGGAEAVPPVRAEERATRQGPHGKTV